MNTYIFTSHGAMKADSDEVDEIAKDFLDSLTERELKKYILTHQIKYILSPIPDEFIKKVERMKKDKAVRFALEELSLANVIYGEVMQDEVI